MVKASVLVAVLTLFAAVGLDAKADDAEQQYDLNMLAQQLGLNEIVSECAQMALSVDLNGEERADEIGLTREAISNAAEPRLRFAGLLAPDLVLDILRVRADFVGPAFSTHVSLYRSVPDLGYGRGGFVTVWQTMFLGIHGGSSQFVLFNLSEQLDEFLAKYLRANEKECAARN